MPHFLQQVIDGQPDNYLLPFFWIDNEHRDQIIPQIEAVYKSGARAFCVESRIHKNFCQQEWWEDLSLILKEAQKRQMKVWIFDDKAFPTGYANGLIAEKYPERRKWQLIEHHVDVLGPQTQATFLLPPQHANDQLLDIYAYRRTGQGEALTGESICLTGAVQKDLVLFDVPEGAWRIFFFYQSRKGTNPSQIDFIHLIDPLSVQVLIEAVYQPHYERFHEYFGTTIAGFFSDEPSFGNVFFNDSVPKKGMQNRTLAMPGLALPWSEQLQKELLEDNPALGNSALAALWYPMGENTGEIRYAYMNRLTRLYEHAFTRQLGDWCHQHGVQYIGHVIEDMNAHARLSSSVGHYFRGLAGQDMSGMDIVLHQVRPGFGHLKSNVSASQGVADPLFYHYILAQLCTSMAQLNPAMEKRALCEVFGAYGWAEGVPMMKWLIDFLLVRGINHFIPHAFSGKYPNSDCPPHFYANGNDPQFSGFAKLMEYTNQVSHLFSGATRASRIAIFYHAEAEWMNPGDNMLMEEPAKILYDNHFLYELVPMDYLSDGAIESRTLTIHDMEFDCLLLPDAPALPKTYLTALKKLEKQGLAIYVVTQNEQTSVLPFPNLPLAALPTAMSTLGIHAYSPVKTAPFLRINHMRKEGLDLFMLFNESTTQTIDTSVPLGIQGSYLKLNLLHGDIVSSTSHDATVQIQLSPYESVLFVFGESLPQMPRLNKKSSPLKTTPLSISWSVSLKESGVETKYRVADKLPSKHSLTSITAPDKYPFFSGTMRYQGSFTLPSDFFNKDIVLSLGQVGEICSLSLNGTALGQRLCPPYCYTITEIVQEGENHLEVTVNNTLAYRLRDRFSSHLPLSPSGLLGPVTLECY